MNPIVIIFRLIYSDRVILITNLQAGRIISNDRNSKVDPFQIVSSLLIRQQKYFKYPSYDVVILEKFFGKAMTSLLGDFHWKNRPRLRKQVEEIIDTILGRLKCAKITQ